MTEQILQGNLSIHWCKNVYVKLDEHGETRWLTIGARNGSHHAELYMFFDTKEDEESIIKHLYAELGKIQSTKEILFRKFK